MSEKESHEAREGADAYKSGKSASDNPYPHDNQNWWRNEEWERGRKKAESDSNNDDYDDD